MKKILLIGGKSAVAGELKVSLRELGDILTAGKSGCDFQMDLAAPAESIQIPKGIDIVVNLAAHFGGPEPSSLYDATKVNLLGSLALMEACKKSQVSHVIQFSTIFTVCQMGSWSGKVYANTKRIAEELCTLFSNEFELPLTVIQPSQIYGTGDTFRRHQPFLYHIIDQAELSRDICFYGSHDPLRNFIHVEDVCRITKRIIETGVTGIFKCMSLQHQSYSEIAQAAVRAFNSKSEIHFDPNKPNIDDICVPVDDALYQQIDYYPRIGMDEGMVKEAFNRSSLK